MPLTIRQLLLRGNMQSSNCTLAHPLPVEGKITPYGLRQLCGVGGKGRDIPGVMAFPDPIDKADDPVDSLSPGWEVRNVPSLLLQLDESTLFEFFTAIVARERLSFSNTVAAFLDLFDPDKCPEVYLPYLARTVGVVLDGNASVNEKRRRISAAIPLFKQKGTVPSFVRLFNAMGYAATVYHVYLMPPASYRRSSLDAVWATSGFTLANFVRQDVLVWPLESPYPDYPPGFDDKLLTPTNYIDIRLASASGTLDLNAGAAYRVIQDTEPTDNLGDPADDYYGSEEQRLPRDIEDVDAFVRALRQAVEEVRPIHVILRLFVLIFGITDKWPEIVLDTDIGVVYDVHDDWLANSGRFADTRDYPSNVHLRETNHTPPIVRDGMTMRDRGGKRVTSANFIEHLQHRTGVAGFRRDGGYPQQYVHRPYWGPVEPHRSVSADTVPLAGQSNYLTNWRSTWTPATAYAVGDTTTRTLTVPQQSHAFKFAVNCILAHTSDASNAPYTGANWRLYWSPTDPPVGKPAPVVDHCFAIDLSEHFEAGVLPPGWVPDVSGSGVLNFKWHSDQRHWLRVVQPTGGSGAANAQVLATAGVDTKLPYVFEFDFRPRDYGDAGGAVLAQNGGRIFTIELGGVVAGYLSYAATFTGLDIAATVQFTGASIGTGLPTLPAMAVTRIKLAISGTNTARLYFDDVLVWTGSLLTTISGVAYAAFGATNSTASIGHFDDVVTGRGIGPVVEDIIEIVTYTGTTTSTTSTTTTVTTTSTTTTTTSTTSTTSTSTSTSTSTTTTTTSTTSTTTSTTSTTTTTTSTTSTTTLSTSTIGTVTFSNTATFTFSTTMTGSSTIII